MRGGVREGEGWSKGGYKAEGRQGESREGNALCSNDILATKRKWVFVWA